jgi:4-diphosphocytidyl-2-C-methyl-D-erythritol kinase
MQISCPAKINLFLKVLGKRNDGFHRLESLLAFTNLQDFLEVEKSEIFQLEISGIQSNLIDKNHNLFTEIFKFFKTEFNLKSSVKIILQKNIPIGGGLGGGSSNAASFMILLNKIFKLNLEKETLQKISLNFGSDIAFFFENYASIIKGRGEIIENFPEFQSFSALLINPKIHLSTKEIFENFQQNYSNEIATENLLKENIFTLTKNLVNDLEKPAIKAAVEVGEILKNCQNLKAKITKMSGSGSTCFAIFENEKDLQKTINFFSQNFPNYFLKKTTISHKNPSKII